MIVQEDARSRKMGERSSDPSCAICCVGCDQDIMQRSATVMSRQDGELCLCMSLAEREPQKKEKHVFAIGGHMYVYVI